MLIRRDTVFQFFKDSLSIALVIAGLFSLVIGLLYVSPAGTLTAALGLFLGVLLIDAGFAVRFELFVVKLRSKEGIGNLMICIAPLLIASGVISMLFAEPDWSMSFIMPPTRLGWLGFKSGWVTVLAPLVRIYLWIAIPLTIVGVVLFLVGFLLRLYDAVS